MVSEKIIMSRVMEKPRGMEKPVVLRKVKVVRMAGMKGLC